KETNVPDGTDLMHKIFTGNPPLLLFRNDNSDTAKNIQEGFRFMFASTLMYAVDEAVRNKEVSESFQCI
ncbi:MAG: hypothetical protein J5915_01410, partial [Acidaminococcaceae bacterium]|nr:hypothetical protein [Acidaminococcaceae bacterium]